MSLDDGNFPLLMIFAFEQVFKQILIPEEATYTDIPLMPLLVEALWSLSEIPVEREVEAEIENLLVEGLQNRLLFLWFSTRETDKLDRSNLINTFSFGQEGGLLVHVVGVNQKIWLFDLQYSQNQTTVGCFDITAVERESFPFLCINAWLLSKTILLCFLSIKIWLLKEGIRGSI